MSAKKYQELVKSATGFMGAFPLIVPVKVGDYFEMNDSGVLVHLGNVFNWPGWAEAVPVDSEPLNGSDTYFAGCERVAGVNAGGGVTAPSGLGAEASVEMAFSSESGFALAYDAATRTRVRDVPALRRQVVELVRSKWWEEKWILVTEVIAAESATLIVSSSTGAKLSLHANVKVPGALAGVKIADPSLGWTASSWKGTGVSSLCKAGTPLFHCIKVKKGFFGGLSAELLGDDDHDSAFVTDDLFDE